MNRENYFKYYIQGSDHYLLPKDIFDELFQEMVSWREGSQQLENNWNELKEWLEEHWKESQDIWFVKIINKMQEIESRK